jgi:3-methyladenine DNA glycosylase/8-oxoguanine DNA glycosylase
MTTITIPTPDGFRFVPTVRSHGWYMLPPFSYDAEGQVLRRIHRLSDGTSITLRVSDAAHSSALRVDIDSAGVRPTRRQQAEVAQLVRSCLNLTHDLAPFYRSLRGRPKYRWVAKLGAGRILVAPTVWEDMVKTLLTTNTTWAGTVGMCRRLATLGEPHDGGHCFPTPERIAGMSLDDLSGHVRAGYRTAYLHRLATAVTDGSLDVESWRGAEVSGEDLYRRIRSIKGFGDYAAGSVLRLLGKYDRLAIDTSCRAAYQQHHNNGAKGSDGEIRAYYEPFGAWRGLVMWMDVMKQYLTPRP